MFLTAWEVQGNACQQLQDGGEARLQGRHVGSLSQLGVSNSCRLPLAALYKQEQSKRL